MQISDRRCYHVRLGETLQSVALRDPLMQDARLWKLLAEINGLPTELDQQKRPVAKLARGQYLVLPTAAEVVEYRKLNRFSDTTPSGRPASILCAPDSGVPALKNNSATGAAVEAEKLSDICRVVTINGTICSIILQIQHGGRWVTVSRYDCGNLGTARSIFHQSGTVATFKVDLPMDVAIDMAKEDYRRNFNLYCEVHFSKKSQNFVPERLVNSMFCQ
jgi:hypothetical protein